MIRYALWSLLFAVPAVAADMGSPLPLEQQVAELKAEVSQLRIALNEARQRVYLPPVDSKTATGPIVSPFGAAPTASGFSWRELPGVGWGWVHESVNVATFAVPPVATRTAAPFQPIRYTLGAVGNCVNGQCYR